MLLIVICLVVSNLQRSLVLVAFIIILIGKICFSISPKTNIDKILKEEEQYQMSLQEEDPQFYQIFAQIKKAIIDKDYKKLASELARVKLDMDVFRKMINLEFINDRGILCDWMTFILRQYGESEDGVVAEMLKILIENGFSINQVMSNGDSAGSLIKTNRKNLESILREKKHIYIKDKMEIIDTYLKQRRINVVPWSQREKEELMPIEMMIKNTEVEISLDEIISNQAKRKIFSQEERKIKLKELIIKASQYGCINIVKKCIKEKVNLDVYDDQKRTPLISACIQGNLEIVRLLTEGGASVNFCHPLGIRAFTMVCLKGKGASAVSILKYLIMNGATLNNGHISELTPMVASLLSGNEYIIDYLMKKYSMKREGGSRYELMQDVLEVDYRGERTVYRALELAMMTNNGFIVKMFCKHDWVMNERKEVTASLIMKTIEQKKYFLIPTLIQYLGVNERKHMDALLNKALETYKDSNVSRGEELKQAEVLFVLFQNGATVKKVNQFKGLDYSIVVLAAWLFKRGMPIGFMKQAVIEKAGWDRLMEGEAWALKHLLHINHIVFDDDSASSKWKSWCQQRVKNEIGLAVYGFNRERLSERTGGSDDLLFFREVRKEFPLKGPVFSDLSVIGKGMNWEHMRKYIIRMSAKNEENDELFCGLWTEMEGMKSKRVEEAIAIKDPILLAQPVFTGGQLLFERIGEKWRQNTHQNVYREMELSVKEHVQSKIKKPILNLKREINFPNSGKEKSSDEQIQWLLGKVSRQELLEILIDIANQKGKKKEGLEKIKDPAFLLIELGYSVETLELYLNIVGQVEVNSEGETIFHYILRRKVEYQSLIGRIFTTIRSGAYRALMQAIHIKDTKGRNLLMIAQKSQLIRCTVLLLNYTDINDTDLEGKKISHYFMEYFPKNLKDQSIKALIKLYKEQGVNFLELTENGYVFEEVNLERVEEFYEKNMFRKSWPSLTIDFPIDKGGVLLTYIQKGYIEGIKKHMSHYPGDVDKYEVEYQGKFLSLVEYALLSKQVVIMKILLENMKNPQEKSKKLVYQVLESSLSPEGKKFILKYLLQELRMPLYIKNEKDIIALCLNGSISVGIIEYLWSLSKNDSLLRLSIIELLKKEYVQGKDSYSLFMFFCTKGMNKEVFEEMLEKSPEGLLKTNDKEKNSIMLTKLGLTNLAKVLVDLDAGYIGKEGLFEELYMEPSIFMERIKKVGRKGRLRTRSLQEQLKILEQTDSEGRTLLMRAIIQGRDQVAQKILSHSIWLNKEIEKEELEKEIQLIIEKKEIELEIKERMFMREAEKEIEKKQQELNKSLSSVEKEDIREKVRKIGEFPQLSQKEINLIREKVVSPDYFSILSKQEKENMRQELLEKKGLEKSLVLSVKGIDINQKDNNGWTAWDYAHEKVDKKLLTALSEFKEKTPVSEFVEIIKSENIEKLHWVFSSEKAVFEKIKNKDESEFEEEISIIKNYLSKNGIKGDVESVEKVFQDLEKQRRSGEELEVHKVIDRITASQQNKESVSRVHIFENRQHTLLSMACHMGSLKVVEFLIEKAHAPIDYKVSAVSKSCYQEAFEQGHQNICEYLKKNGAQTSLFNVGEGINWSVEIWRAMVSKNRVRLAHLIYLLKNFRQKEEVEKVIFSKIVEGNKQAVSLLGAAVGAGDIESVKLLVEELKCPINYVDKNVDLAYQIAIKNQYYEIAQYLIERGSCKKRGIAKVWEEDEGDIVLDTTDLNYLKLMNYIKNKDTWGFKQEWSQLTNKQKQDFLQLKDKEREETALQYAIRLGLDEICHLLIKVRILGNVNKKGETALIQLCQRGKTNLIEEVLKILEKASNKEQVRGYVSLNLVSGGISLRAIRYASLSHKQVPLSIIERMIKLEGSRKNMRVMLADSVHSSHVELFNYALKRMSHKDKMEMITYEKKSSILKQAISKGNVYMIRELKKLYHRLNQDLGYKEEYGKLLAECIESALHEDVQVLKVVLEFVNVNNANYLRKWRSGSKGQSLLMIAMDESFNIANRQKTGEGESEATIKLRLINEKLGWSIRRNEEKIELIKVLLHAYAINFKYPDVFSSQLFSDYQLEKDLDHFSEFFSSHYKGKTIFDILNEEKDEEKAKRWKKVIFPCTSWLDRIKYRFNLEEIENEEFLDEDSTDKLEYHLVSLIREVEAFSSKKVINTRLEKRLKKEEIFKNKSKEIEKDLNLIKEVRNLSKLELSNEEGLEVLVEKIENLSILTEKEKETLKGLCTERNKEGTKDDFWKIEDLKVEDYQRYIEVTKLKRESEQKKQKLVNDIKRLRDKHEGRLIILSDEGDEILEKEKKVKKEEENLKEYEQQIEQIKLESQGEDLVHLQKEEEKRIVKDMLELKIESYKKEFVRKKLRPILQSLREHYREVRVLRYAVSQTTEPVSFISTVEVQVSELNRMESQPQMFVGSFQESIEEVWRVNKGSIGSNGTVWSNAIEGSHWSIVKVLLDKGGYDVEDIFQQNKGLSSVSSILRMVNELNIVGNQQKPITKLSVSQVYRLINRSLMVIGTSTLTWNIWSTEIIDLLEKYNQLMKMYPEVLTYRNKENGEKELSEGFLWLYDSGKSYHKRVGIVNEKIGLVIRKVRVILIEMAKNNAYFSTENRNFDYYKDLYRELATTARVDGSKEGQYNSLFKQMILEEKEGYKLEEIANRIFELNTKSEERYYWSVKDDWEEEHPKVANKFVSLGEVSGVRKTFEIVSPVHRVTRMLVNLEGETEIIKCLLQYDQQFVIDTLIERPVYTEEKRYSSLIVAVLKGHIGLVKGMLSKVNVDTINYQDSDGRTALHYAIKHDQHEMVKLLLLAGADPMLKNNKNNTAFDKYMARSHQDKEILRLFFQGRKGVATPEMQFYFELVGQNADVQSSWEKYLEEIGEMSNKRGERKLEPILMGKILNYSITERSFKEILKIKKIRKSFNQRVGTEKMLPIEIAIQKGNMQIVKGLLELYQKQFNQQIDQSSLEDQEIEKGILGENKDKKNILHYAAESGSTELLDLIVDHIKYLYPDKKMEELLASIDSKGETIIMKAVRSGNEKVVRLVMELYRSQKEFLINLSEGQEGSIVEWIRSMVKRRKKEVSPTREHSFLEVKKDEETTGLIQKIEDYEGEELNQFLKDNKESLEKELKSIEEDNVEEDNKSELEFLLYEEIDDEEEQEQPVSWLFSNEANQNRGVRRAVKPVSMLNEEGESDMYQSQRRSEKELLLGEEGEYKEGFQGLKKAKDEVKNKVTQTFKGFSIERRSRGWVKFDNDGEEKKDLFNSLPIWRSQEEKFDKEKGAVVYWKREGGVEIQTGNTFEDVEESEGELILHLNKVVVKGQGGQPLEDLWSQQKNDQENEQGLGDYMTLTKEEANKRDKPISQILEEIDEDEDNELLDSKYRRVGLEEILSIKNKRGKQVLDLTREVKDDQVRRMMEMHIIKDTQMQVKQTIVQRIKMLKQVKYSS